MTLDESRRVRIFKLLLAAGWLCATLGCGYSEDEWQAQLAKYSELDSTHKRESAK